MKIAITGSSGMIGATIVQRALEKGYEVLALVRPGSERINNLPSSKNLSLIECDISNYHSQINKESCDIFFHLAWDKTSGPGRDDISVQNENIKYTLDAVDLAHSWGSTVFIGAGSQAEYGRTTMKLGVKTPVNPESGYGIAKYAAGKLSSIKCNQLGMRFSWGRIVSSYGELDADYTLIMYLIKTLLRGDVPELTPCEQIWDYIYSEDVAEAFLAIGNDGKNGKAYCIGSGDCRRMKDYVISVRNIINPKLKLGFGMKEYYPHQPMHLCTDISDLTKDTGFIPKYSFEEGIVRTIEYVAKEK